MTGGLHTLQAIRRYWYVLGTLVLTIASLVLAAPQAMAAATTENPKPGSIGVEGTIPSAAPTRAATISTPSNGQSLSQTPVTISGLCQTGLLVKVFSNNVFIGSAVCVNGSYSLQVGLFGGQNDIIARVFDELDQAGPDSNVVTVRFSDGQFNPAGFPLPVLTSNFARRGANPGDTLTWPVILSGGTGPYAISVDWGDGKTADLISQSIQGTVNLSHIYDTAGTYTITIKATDKNGMSAFLQVVGVANGAASANQDNKDDKTKIITKVLWWPAAILLPLIPLAFWLGRRYELAAIRKHLERD